MFARVNCPACQHKFTIPEGDMGKRHSCPNCQTPFVAGKFVQEADVPMKMQPAVEAAGTNKTMLVDAAPPIRYNCPRCKKPLESPAIEAGTKKPCPECGQRMQIPAAPPAPAPVAPPPNLNKTLLASDDTNGHVPAKKEQPNTNKTMLGEVGPPIQFNCPRCKKALEVPSIEAGTKKPCPGCGQRLQVPTASAAAAARIKTDESSALAAGEPSTVPSSKAGADNAQANKRLMMIGGGVLGGFILLLLLGCIIPAVIRGSRGDDPALAAAHKELENLKAQIEQGKIQAAKNEAEQMRKLEALFADQKNRERDLERQRDLDRLNLQYQNDQDFKRKRDAEIAEKERQLRQERQDAEVRQKQFQDQMKTQNDLLQAQIKAANDRQTIIQQAPAVIHYPPYHPGYYRPWW